MTRFTALGSYTIPKIDAQIGGTVRSDKGALLAANWAAPNSAIAPSLGRNLSNNAPTATVNLITPGTLYGDRVNELDLRLREEHPHRPRCGRTSASTSTTCSTARRC